jgi:hypothetical protein
MTIQPRFKNFVAVQAIDVSGLEALMVRLMGESAR